ncbi:exodeoxyribonuclease-3 [Arcanobacterium pluranimalium]|uniref:exodeoxyribonuclease III n=1 Tax=Arcanobacterium pluranimalium TaxID=108028 RepID=UPI00195A72C6|nr:exodeoxyribonuclease III [Arcanobacterium pluranimalium]MBM7825062.1 exodeoxyribonuclease-3 [Arcanobacterium pluranimalium]
MLIATCNVNGLRAAVRKGMQQWISDVQPDVLLLQEVRAPEDLVPELIGEPYEIYQQASLLAGRAGVAIAVKRGVEVSAVRLGIAEGLDDGATELPVDTGRWIEVDIPQFDTTFISAYLHSGVADKPEKMEAKYAHLDRVTLRLEQLQQSRPQAHVLVAGDFNIVHTERDIKNWKPNHNKTAGVLDPEIAYLDRWFGDLGFVDTQRALVGEEQGPYTWWSQRGRAFDNNVGWRIDYQMTNPQLASRAQWQRVDRAQGHDSRWSDHAPLVIEYGEN